MRKLLAALAFVLWAAIPASAQQWTPGGTGSPVVCAFNSAPPTISSGNFIYAQCDTNGKLILSGGVSGTVSNASSGVATSSTNIGSVSWIYGFNGTTWDQLRSLGTPNFSLSVDTPTTSSNLYAALTSSIPSGSNTIGNVGLAAVSGVGATQYHHYSVATAGGDTQNIKNAAGTIYSIDWYSTTATAMEVKLYDLASAPTCSSGTGVVGNFLIPANTAAPGAHLPFAVGKGFATGISYCIVAAGSPQSDTDAGTPATGVSLMVDYK